LTSRHLGGSHVRPHPPANACCTLILLTASKPYPSGHPFFLTAGHGCSLVSHNENTEEDAHSKAIGGQMTIAAVANPSSVDQEGFAENAQEWGELPTILHRKKTGGRKKGSKNKETVKRARVIAAIKASGTDRSASFADLQRIRSTRSPISGSQRARAMHASQACQRWIAHWWQDT
jgi:hypothetical protein